MPDILRSRFPYCTLGYDDHFINKAVIFRIRDFCREHPVIRAFYAKGSLVHGCMIPGSDIDHVRIRLHRAITVEEKANLIDFLEGSLKKLGVSKLQRIREDGYARMFVEWKELENMPYAMTRKYEIYPALNLITARNANEWLRKIFKTGYSYTGRADLSWAARMRERIMKLDH